MSLTPYRQPLYLNYFLEQFIQRFLRCRSIAFCVEAADKVGHTDCIVNRVFQLFLEQFLVQTRRTLQPVLL